MGKTKIPARVSLEHYMAIKSILEHFLQDLESVLGGRAKWVTCRLNQSGTKDLKGFFLGWLENEKLRAIRIRKNRPDPGFFRFLDDVKADTYQNCLNNPKKLQKQYWKPITDGGVGVLKREELKLYLDGGYFKLPTDHETCRLSVAIKVGNRYVGTLNTGLSKDPGTKINNKMKQWGQSDTSELVQYIKNEFALGGPSA